MGFGFEGGARVRTRRWVWLVCAGAWVLGMCAAAQPGRVAETRTLEGGAAAGAPGDAGRITGKERLRWFLRSTAGPGSLTGGLFAAGLGTAIDSPGEYGPQWEGFGKRYGMRLTGVATGNAMEAGLGVLLREDPRYFAATGKPFGAQVRNVVDLTFRAYHTDGERHLAVARYAATAGNNLLSNTWRAGSEADWQHAVLRTAEGFGARALANTFAEFAPELWRKLRHRGEP
ncbi:hypothetical protein DYQ86_20420 [Acidobacteria bacterium AB60]|nr:hypothetical protein DYQ86_20420 [Acidobacteria bacterium AB60]